jgi:epoxide hydrolase-like predicted phosphatase
MPYKAIFFDWGGVIADDPGDEFLSKLLLSIGASEAQVAEIFETYMKRFMKGNISEDEYWQELREHYGLSIHDTISEEFLQWRGLQANQTVLDLAAQARAKGIKTAILSNVIEPTYAVIEQAGYYDLFDTVIASCKVGYAKPEKEIYLLALERLGIESREAVFIDDKLKCITPADELGFTTILVNNPNQLVADLRELIDLVGTS